NSPQLVEALRKVEKVAPTDSMVLVLGETGTGKELVARAIHNRSARRDRPLVKGKCAGSATGLGEGELFGPANAAFAGALGGGVGRVAGRERGAAARHQGEAAGGAEGAGVGAGRQ